MMVMVEEAYDGLVQEAVGAKVDGDTEVVGQEQIFLR